MFLKVLESDLHALNIQLKDLNIQLEDKKSDSIYSPRYSSYIGSPNNCANNGSQIVNAPIVINRYLLQQKIFYFIKTHLTSLIILELITVH